MTNATPASLLKKLGSTDSEFPCPTKNSRRFHLPSVENDKKVLKKIALLRKTCSNNAVESPGRPYDQNQYAIRSPDELDTCHHNWVIARELGCVPCNSYFHQKGNQQTRKLISTCMGVSRAIACAHTPHLPDSAFHRSAVTDLLSIAYKFPNENLDGRLQQPTHWGLGISRKYTREN